MVYLSKRRKVFVEVLVPGESPELVAKDCLGPLPGLKI